MNVLHEMASKIFRKYSTRRTIALLVLVPLATCLARPALAEGVVLAPPAVVTAPAPAPVLTLPPAPSVPAELPRALAALDAAVHAAAGQLGVPTTLQLPPSFLESTAGKVVIGIAVGLLVATAVTSTAISAYQATR